VLGEILRLLMNHGIPEDIRWLIEAKVRLLSESFNSFISYICLEQVKALLQRNVM
jgi:hypothetical protein